MTMDAEKKAKVEEYINNNEPQWFWKLAKGIVEDLTWLKEETESWQENGPEKWFLSLWLKNNETMLAYAELAMKTEKLTPKESIKYKLLELRLSIPFCCPYFADFKEFLEELKRWPDTSKQDKPSTETSTEASTEASSKASSKTWTEVTTDSIETSNHTFCWTNIRNIKSKPFQKNSRTWVTWCSKTARLNWYNFGLVLGTWETAFIAWRNPWKDSLQTIPANKINKKPKQSWTWIKIDIFKNINSWNFADIYTDSKSRYGHRAIAFKDDNWQWYVLDPYTRINGELDNSPKKLEDYLKVRKIVKAHIYKSNWYNQNRHNRKNNT